MVKSKVFHQVTFDEYIAMQKDLFPDEPSVPAARSASRSARRVSASAPVFPAGAIDGIGAAPAAPSPLEVVRSFARRKMSG